MPIPRGLSLLLTVSLCACATSTPVPTPAPGAPPPVTPTSARAPAAPDPTRVYADLLGKSEDLPRVVRAPKEYEGRSIVVYGLRNGDLRPLDKVFSMPLAGADGRPTVTAPDKPGNNQFYLSLSDDFAREARERKMLPAASRSPVFVECRVAAQTVGRVTSYPCDVVRMAVIGDNRITDLLGRANGGALEYFRY